MSTPAVIDPETRSQKLHHLLSEGEEMERKYMELLYAVERAFPGETRHQTALRYIVTTEALAQASGTGCEASKV